MSDNKLISFDNQKRARGYILSCRSGLMTGISAGADVFGFVNLGVPSFAITSLSAWWLNTTDFDSAQSMAFAFHRVLGFTAIHDTGSPIACAVRPKSGSDLSDVSASTMTAAISATAAITGATYTAADDDEPDFPMVSAPDLAPTLIDTWVPVDGMPLVLPTNTGLVGKLLTAMGSSGVGRLFVRVEGFTETP